MQPVIHVWMGAHKATTKVPVETFASIGCVLAPIHNPCPHGWREFGVSGDVRLAQVQNEGGDSRCLWCLRLQLLVEKPLNLFRFKARQTEDGL